MSRNRLNGSELDQRVAPDLVTEEDELEALYSPEYLHECASGDARKERLEELKRRIEKQGYDIDPARIAEQMLSRVDFDD